MARKKEKKDIVAQLEDRYLIWEKLYHSGGSDPFWEDGVGLNLIRNHIIFYKKQIEEKYTPENYPDIYYRDTPEEVDKTYMAQADKIRDEAHKSLQLYKNDSNLKYIQKKVLSLNEKERNKIPLLHVLHNISWLENAIMCDDLVTMRRHQNPENYLKSYSDCAKMLQEWQVPENQQMSFFDSFDEINEEEEMDWEV